MNDFPIGSDNLFIEETNPIMGAWLQNPTNKFFLYSEGYKQAGDILYQQFNYRQYIELRLKELITMGYKYLGLDKDFKDIHDLEKLWKTYKVDILKNITEVDLDLLDNVERLIHEFNRIDPGFAFRYPVTRGPNRQEAITMRTVDLHNFKSSFDKLARFLEYQWDTLDNYQDLKNDYIAEMMSEMYRDNGY
jgi:hypothetical protein